MEKTELVDFPTYLEIRTQAEAAGGAFGDYVEVLAANWECATEALGAVLIQMGEAIAVSLESMGEELLPLFQRFHVTLQRIQLQTILLRRWHLSYRLALFIAKRCPERWLPELDAEKWWG